MVDTNKDWCKAYLANFSFDKMTSDWARGESIEKYIFITDHAVAKYLLLSSFFHAKFPPNGTIFLNSLSASPAQGLRV